MTSLSERLYPLLKGNLILLLFFLIFGGLYLGRTFFIPLTYAAVLAMLMTPLCEKLEAEGVHKVLATFLCVLLLIVFILGLGTILSTQFSSFSENIPQIEQRISQTLREAQMYISETFGISPEEQDELVQGDSSGESSAGTSVFLSAVTAFLSSFTSILGNSLLTLVYLFMLLFYRKHFAGFILKLVRNNQRERAQKVIDDSAKVAQQYLVGRGLLMLNLFILYSIGLSLIGLNNAIILAFIAALFSIIPYIGNVIGVAIPLLMAFTQDEGITLVLWVLVVFSLIQFFESYFLEPYVVGAEVDIHPFFTIVIIIVGELVWGISGMILAIPLLGIVKIIFSNIDEMEPYAYLIGDTTGGNSSGFRKKIKGWFSGGE